MNAKQGVLLGAVAAAIVVAVVASALLDEEEEADGRLQVVASFYPLAYFAEEIGGEHVRVTTLIPHNQEVHSWQPSTSDIVRTEEADVILYNGAGLDHRFEEDVLGAVDSGGKVVVETTEGLELLEGSGDHDHAGVDPHTWVSPHMAMLQAGRVHGALVEADPANGAYYDQRWSDLEASLEGLDARYAGELNGSARGEIFVNHAAFGYLAYRYGFDQYGVIGLSADEQPSAAAISELVELMIDHGTYVVFVDPIYSDEYARTLRDEVEAQTGEDVRVLTLYFALGPVDGKDYIQQLEANLESLKVGLEA